MKIRILMLLTAGLLCLTGCARTRESWETVTDRMQLPAVDVFENAMCIRYDLPELIGEPDAAAGEYSVESRVLALSDVRSAAHILTGKPWKQLHPVKTTRFGLPEYRFVWCGDGQVCRADLIADTDCCYAVVFRCEEEVSGQYDTMAEAIFASINLFYDEGF